MCGIYGYIGKNKSAEEIVFTGLRKLEYRGYDSWGIASYSKKLQAYKAVGKISESEYSPKTEAKIAIGHTRWATHGSVTKANSHPHLLPDQNLALVHNGIIENYLEIEKLLKRNDFRSDTDTERFLYLLGKLVKSRKLQESVFQAITQIEGLNAFVGICGQKPMLVAIKNGSPLIIGYGEDGFHIASDVMAFAKEVKNITYLEDQQVAFISQDICKVYNFDTQEVVLKKVTRPVAAVTPQKGHFSYFMLKEMHDQVGLMKDWAKKKVPQLSESSSSVQGLSLIGCGTAYHAALVGQYLFSEAGIMSQAYLGSEYEHFFKNDPKLSLFLSQSGETADIVDAAKKRLKLNYPVVALVNVKHSNLDHLATSKIYLEAGTEISVVTTKAFMAKLAVLSLLSGRAKPKDLIQASEVLKKLLQPSWSDLYLKKVIDQLMKSSSLFILGRGVNYPLAMETALKIKEASYLHVEAFAGGELKHGVISLIEKGKMIVVFAPQDKTYKATISNAIEVKSRGGTIIGISQEDNQVFDYWIPIEGQGSLNLFTQALVGQLLAYHLSVSKGLDPDKPRNLAKSVTVK